MNIDELDAKDIGNAAKKVAQKVGTGARAIGQKIGAKGSGSMMGKAMDKVAKGEALPANLAKQIAPFAKQLETILSDQALRQKFMMVVKQAEKVQKANAGPGIASKAAGAVGKAAGAAAKSAPGIAGVAAKAAGGLGGTIAKGAKAAASAVGKVVGTKKSKEEPSVSNPKASAGKAASPKVASTKNAAAGDTFEKAKGDIRKVQGGQKPLPPKFAADIQASIAKLAKGDKENGVAAAQKIMKFASKGIDVSKQQQAWIANAKAGERFLTQSIYFEISKMLREHNLSWSDLGMRVHLLEGTNSLFGISLI
tara:strand:- start:154 stop:1080 length:927 start_codon:yes stop_codon:yes gene_type:complete